MRPNKISPKAAPSALLGLSAAELAGFNLLEVCRNIDNPRDPDFFKEGTPARAAETLEILASAAMAVGGSRRGGYVLPADLTGIGNGGLVRGANLTEPSEGGFLQGSTNKGLQADALRPHSKVLQLADRVDNAPPGEVLIGRLDSGAVGYWLDEDEEAPRAEQSVGLLRASPKTVAAHIYLPRAFLRHTVPGSDQRLQRDLLRGIAQTAEAGLLTGIGGRIEPLGLLSQDDTGSVVGGENGLAPAWGHIVDLEGALTDASADTSRAAYLMPGAMRRALKKTPEDATANVGGWIWQPFPGQTDPTIGRVNGYPAHVSNLVPSTLVKGDSSDCSAIIFANWEDVLVVSWGPIELIIDRYTESKRGGVTITAFWDIDLVLLRPQSVAIMRDARPPA